MNIKLAGKDKCSPLFLDAAFLWILNYALIVRVFHVQLCVDRSQALGFYFKFSKSSFLMDYNLV